MVDYTPIAPNSAEPETAVNAALEAFAEAIDNAGGLPEDGEPGQILAKTADGLEWIDSASGGFPDDGEPGQVLTKTADGVAWMTPSGGGGGGGGGSPSIVLVKRSYGTYAAPTNGWNLLPWSIVDIEDIAGVWNPAQPARFTVPAGVSRIRFTAWFLFANQGNKYVHLVDKNNQDVGFQRPGTPTQSLFYSGDQPGGMQMVTRWLPVVEGDWFTFQWFYLSGGFYSGADNGQPYCQVELS